MKKNFQIFLLIGLIFVMLPPVLCDCSNNKARNVAEVSNSRAEIERELRAAIDTDSLVRQYFDCLYRGLAQDSAHIGAKWFLANVPPQAEKAFQLRWKRINENLKKDGKSVDCSVILIGILCENVWAEDSVTKAKLAQNALTAEDVELFLVSLRDREGNDYFLVNPEY